MVVINTETKRVYSCSRIDAAKILGVCPRTLYRWEHEKKLKEKKHRNKRTRKQYTAIFSAIEKIKQPKGFALKKAKI